VKLAAIDRIMDIYGLAAPKEHKIDGKLSGEGPPATVITEIVVTTREEAKAILALEAEKKAAFKNRIADQNGCPVLPGSGARKALLLQPAGWVPVLRSTTFANAALLLPASRSDHCHDAGPDRFRQPIPTLDQ